MEQLVLTKEIKKERSRSTVIRIDGEAAEILADLANASGVSKYKICSELIKTFTKYVEIVEEEEK